MKYTGHSGELMDLRGIHCGKKIAVVGSGPTAELFSYVEDVSIAVNGGANMRYTDYFLCMDRRSPDRDWFYVSENATRIVSAYIIPFDKKCYPDAEERRTVQADMARTADLCFVTENELRIAIANGKSRELHYFKPAIKPRDPHIFFNVGDDINTMNMEQDIIIHGASVSGAALQAAFIMGAKEIHLYGCSFDNGSGSNYCYKPSAGQEGTTRPKHAPNMDRLIEIAMSNGVDVFVHGPSRLTKGNKVEQNVRA